MKNNEYINNIPKEQTKYNFVLIKIPYIGNAISFFNKDKMIYHYKKNSNYYVNEYRQDIRKKYINSNDIECNELRYNKINYVKQIINLNEKYISISDELIREYYAYYDEKDRNIKLITKYLYPSGKKSEIMNEEEIKKLFNNKQVYSPDGSVIKNAELPDENMILDLYKENLIELHEEETQKMKESFITRNEQLENYFTQSLYKLTIDDVPENIEVLNDILMVSDNFDKIDLFIIKFISHDKYLVESYDYIIKDFLIDKKHSTSKEFKILENITALSDRNKIINNQKKLLKKLT